MTQTLVNPQTTMNAVTDSVKIVGYRFSIFPLIIIVVIICIIAQIVLSKKQNKFIGLIIPALYFLAATLYLTFILAIFSGAIDPLSLWALLLLTFVPEAIFLTIYFVSRGRINARNRRKQEMQKMNAQDL